MRLYVKVRLTNTQISSQSTDLCNANHLNNPTFNMYNLLHQKEMGESESHACNNFTPTGTGHIVDWNQASPSSLKFRMPNPFYARCLWLQAERTIQLSHLVLSHPPLTQLTVNQVMRNSNYEPTYRKCFEFPFYIFIKS